MEIEIGNVRSTLIDVDDETLGYVRRGLSTFAPGYKYTWKYKKKLWDGKVAMLNESNTFPTGLLPLVVPMLPGVALRDMRAVPDRDFFTTDVKLRPYQVDAVSTAVMHEQYGAWGPRGIIQIATGGGKTDVAVAMIQMAQVPTLFIVHRMDLVDQAVERMAKYGIEAGTIGQGKMDTVQQVTVATIQSLMSHRHKTNVKTSKGKRSKAQMAEITARKQEKHELIGQFLGGIEQVFVDEAHLMASTEDRGNMFINALEAMPNAYMRWGLTATPFMREEYSNLLMAGATGDVLFERSSAQLISEGYLTAPDITMYRMPGQEGIPNKWPECYDVGVVMNTTRNEMIVREALDRPGPVMILVQKIDHGNILKLMFKEAGTVVEFLNGEANLKERKAALAKLRSGEAHVVIGSTIWDEGLDVAEIRTMILAGAGKSQIKSMQRLGRGLRLSEGKDKVGVVDFLDTTTRWLRQHAVERKALWEREGYVINIVG